MSKLLMPFWNEEFSEPVPDTKTVYMTGETWQDVKNTEFREPSDCWFFASLDELKKLHGGNPLSGIATVEMRLVEFKAADGEEEGR